MAAPTLTSEQDKLKQINAEVQRIMQHQNTGRLEEAGRAIEELLAQYPNHPQLLHLKALNLLRGGQDVEGFALLELVVENEQSNVQALTDLGSFRAMRGDVDAAIPLFDQAVVIAPNNALAQANLGAALVLKERYAPAIEALRKASELDGSVLDTHLNLAQAYIRTNNFKPAVDVLFRALALDPQSVAAHVNLAHALFRAERHEAAEHHARRAIELAPNAVEPKLHLGNTLAAMGRMDEAATVLLEAGKTRAGLSALVRLVNLRKTTPDCPEYELLQAFAAREDDLPAPARASYFFAQGKAAADLGKDAEAIEYYRKANALDAEKHSFDMDKFKARETRMRTLATPDFLAHHQGAGLRDVAPIFICGMPRSGTTLTEQMFSRHSEVQAGGEMRASIVAFQQSSEIRTVLEGEADDSVITDDLLTRFGEYYQAFLHNEGLKSDRVTDKLPINYLYVGILARALPRAKFLIMRRHPMDNLLSNFMQNFGQNQPFSTRIETLAGVYREFDITARHYADVLPDQVRFVSYEALVQDPAAEIRAASDFVGLPFEEAMLDYTGSSRPVNTASVSQVREPIYKTSVAKWVRFAPHLSDLAEALGDILSDEDRKLCGL